MLTLTLRLSNEVDKSVSVEKLTIGTLAKKTGKTTRALRFYEEQGLIEPAERTPGGFRLYSHQARQFVAFLGSSTAIATISRCCSRASLSPSALDAS